MAMDALAPWLDLLPSLGKLYRPLDDEGDRCVDGDGVLWFHWTRAADPSQWPRQLELLGLLSRLAVADPTAFEALLSSLEDAYSQYFVTYRARYEAPYSLGVYVKLEDEDEATGVLEELKMNLSTTPESEFAKATRAIEATQASKPIPVFVEVVTAVEAADSMETMLQSILEQLQYHQNGSMALFQVTVVQASHEDSGVVSNESLAALGRLADAGVCIPRVVIETNATVSTPPEAIVNFVTAIQSLLGVRGVASQTPAPRTDGSQRPRRLQHLVLRPPFSMHIVIALCTAIANSETLQRVSVEAAFNVNHGQPFPMEPFWRWLAYAFFSRGALSNVSVLELDASLLLRFYVQGMQSVAQHEDALTSELDPRLPIPSPWKDSVVDISSGVEVSLVYDYGGGKDVVAAFTPATELQSLRVLQEDVDNGWLYAVMPGWGECRVPRDSATPRTVQASAEQFLNMDELSSPRGVRHVRLNYASGGTLAATEAFLEMAGTHIRRLDIHEPESHDDNIVAVLLVDVLRLCVNIEDLDVFGAEIDSLDVMTDAISIHSRRIKRIKLRQLTVRTMSSAHRFFDALADPMHPLTQHLRDLSFNIIERTIEDQTRGSIFNSCVRMLQSNTTLRDCRAITLSKQRAAKFVDKFDAFDGQRLPARKAPLALPSKLAFLSVVTDTTSSALHAIDVNLLGNIFLLAAENEIRASSVEVAVTYEHSSRG